MKIPAIPPTKFEGKAVLVLEDSRPVGFLKKCPPLTIGESFLLPNGKSAGAITKIDSGYAVSELVASCSFKTDAFPFSFEVYADAREVATYYQRNWRRRPSKQYIHTVTIKVDEELLKPHRGYKYGSHLRGKVFAVYEREELYKRDAFKAFIEKYPKDLTKDTTIVLYGTNYKVRCFTYPSRYDNESKEDNRVKTGIVMTKEEIRGFLANAKLAKHRWQRYYVDEYHPSSWF